MYTDHQQQHRQVYYSDQDYDDVLGDMVVDSRAKRKNKKRGILITQNRKWKVKWNDNVCGIHSSVDKSGTRLENVAEI